MSFFNAQEQVKFNIVQLLKTKRQDSKPNLGKFLKDYVKEIHSSDSGKITFYHNFKYDSSRIFVRFLDGHELIYDMKSDGKFAAIYYMYDGTDEEELSTKDIEAFFDFLLQFSFVYWYFYHDIISPWDYGIKVLSDILIGKGF